MSYASDPFAANIERTSRDMAPIYHGQGEEMAMELGAVRYLECSASTLRGHSAVFEEAVRVTCELNELERCRSAKKSANTYSPTSYSSKSLEGVSEIFVLCDCLRYRDACQIDVRGYIMVVYCMLKHLTT